MTLRTPDHNYRIDAVARSRLKPGVDADALERLLQYFPAECRSSHLAMFSIRRVVADAEGRVPDTTTLDRISDPDQQQLLEEIWQPFWAIIPDAELAHDTGGPPGRELARRRRGEQRRD
jgi:hypothetical protein